MYVTVAFLSGATEYQALTTAMNIISQDLKYCINFTAIVPANAVPTVPFIYFVPAQPPSVTPLCASSHGLLVRAGTQGQTAIVFGSSAFTSSGQSGNAKGACLDNPSSPRDAMRVLVNALGLRNEFMRSDRDTFITFQTNFNSLVVDNLRSLDIFGAAKQYNTATATNQGTFDAQSITMVSGEQWAADPTRPVFTLKSGPSAKPIGTLARLSLGDCSALNLLYRCGITCEDRELFCRMNSWPITTVPCASLLSKLSKR